MLSREHRGELVTQPAPQWEAPGATSRPLLDDFRVQELSGELDAETGIGSGVRGDGQAAVLS
jgi:hypothetical protein